MDKSEMRRPAWLQGILSLAITALMCVGIAEAQATGGALRGTVADANGGVIPNANVQIVNKDTGAKLTTQSSGTGDFSFPNVAVGVYTITADASAFASATKELNVSLNQITSVEITLQAKAVAATVDVTSDSAVLVQTETSQI